MGDEVAVEVAKSEEGLDFFTEEGVCHWLIPDSLAGSMATCLGWIIMPR
jgi:hypothetical protein